VPTPESDPFATAELRRTVLDGWHASPARFREDANAEESLTLTGYANRVVVELAANAADAALLAGEPGRLRLRLVDGELRAANTGAPLTAAGVAALASLRASAKRDDAAGIGHFGVGFTAVLTVTDEPSIVSGTGGVRFSAVGTAAAVRELGSAALDEEILAREGQLPILRLPWPVDTGEGPPEGFTTEVRLPLRPGIDGRSVLAAVGDHLLLALPGLAEIDTPDGVWTRIDEVGDAVVEVGDDSSAPDDGSGPEQDPAPVGSPDRHVRITGPDGSRRWHLVTRSGTAAADLLANRPVEERRRPGWQLTWARPLTGTWSADVIYAPTPTDEAIELPARLIGTFPVDDTRRRLASGALTDHLMDEAVAGYLELVSATRPAERLDLVPPVGFGLGEWDARLRSGIQQDLGRHPFLTTATGAPISPVRAQVLPGAGDRLCELLGEGLPELIRTPTDRSQLTALRSVGAEFLALHEVSRALGGLDRSPDFWVQVYTGLAELGIGASAVGELADLPVPLADGRTVIGVRGCLIADGVDSELLARLVRSVPGLRVIHPDLAASAVAQQLLVRLGAEPATLDTVLAGAALAVQIESLRTDLDEGDADPDDVQEWGRLVLDLMQAGGRLPDTVREQLVLTDVDGEPWPANQLLLPGSALAAVLAADADLPLIDSFWTATYSTDLLAEAGVLSGFRIVHDASAVGPDHDLPDEEEWWESDPQVPLDFWAVADLDLVDEDRWPQAVEILSAHPDAVRCLAPGGYTRWWLSRYAVLDGRPPRSWRLASAVELDGLYDELPAGTTEAVAVATGVRSGLAEVISDDLEGLLDRFTDPHRLMVPGRVPVVTAAIAAALLDSSHPLPDQMRTLAGTVAPAEEVAVLDRPWFAQVVPAEQAVPGGSAPDSVARAFDLPLASAAVGLTLHVEPARGTDHGPDVPGTLRVLGWSSPTQPVQRAEMLAVTWNSLRTPVLWWPGDGVWWYDGSLAGLARCLAHDADRWGDRATLLDALNGQWWTLAE